MPDLIQLPAVTPAQLDAIVSGLRREANHPWFRTNRAVQEHQHACQLLAAELAALKR